MIKSVDEIKSSLSAKLGEDTSDDALALIEDVSDTLADLTSKVNGDGVDWKAKFEQNDAEWRKKYKERFTDPTPTPEGVKQEVEDEPLTYDRLFKEC